MMRTVIIISLAVFVCSCALSKEERRMNRATKKLEKLVDKFPELQKTDTLEVPVTVEIERMVLDTIVLSADTIVVHKENVRVQIIKMGDSLRVTTERKPMIIEKRVSVPCTTIHPTKTVVKNVISTRQKIEIGLALLVVFIIAFVVGYLFGKK